MAIEKLGDSGIVQSSAMGNIRKNTDYIVNKPTNKEQMQKPKEDNKGLKIDTKA